MNQEGVLPTTRRGWALVLALVGLALVLRVAVVAENRKEYVPHTDSAHFDDIATKMVHGEFYVDVNLPPAEGPSAIRAPGYPVFLAGVYLVAGDHAWTAARLANAVIGAAVVALVGLLGAQLWSRREGAIALAIAAVYPPMILAGSSINLEPLLVALGLAVLAAALQHRRRPSGLRWPIVAGALAGFGLLTREIALAVLVAAVALVWQAQGPLRQRFGRRALAAPVALAVAALAVVAPWTVRNAVVMDAFVPVSSGAGFGLAGTFNDTARTDDERPGMWVRPYDDPEVLEVMSRRDHPTELEIDADLRDFVVEYVKEHPTYPFTVTFWNAVRMLELDGGDYTRLLRRYVPYPGYLTTASIYSFMALGLVAVAGAFAPLTRRVPKAFWLAPLLTFAGVVVLLPANVRYRASIEPFVVLLATAAVAWIVDRARRGREAPAAAAETA